MHDQIDAPGSDRSSGDELAPVDELAMPTADTDEAAASEARARFRTFGVEPLEADDRVRALLDPCEQVLAIRHSVALDRRLGSSRTSVIDSIRGDLYVTTTRLVLVGEQVVTFHLDQIEDSALAGESVLLILGDGVGIVLDADRPRLLRVQIAAARAARAGIAERAGDRRHSVSR
jgi:hypothetical protein